MQTWLEVLSHIYEGRFDIAVGEIQSKTDFGPEGAALEQLATELAASSFEDDIHAAAGRHAAVRTFIEKTISACVEEGLWDRALDILAGVRRYAPEEKAAWATAVQILVLHGQSEAAFNLAIDALEFLSSEDRPAMQALAARCSHIAGNAYRAAALYQDSIDLLPPDEALFLRAARTYLDSADPSSAVDLLHRLAGLGNRGDAYALLMGEALWQNRDFQAAISPLRRAHGLFPHDQRLQAMLGFCYLHTRSTDAAVRVLAPLIKAGSDQIDIHHWYLRALIAEDETDIAEDACHQALNRFPDTPLFHRILGELLIERGAYDDAREALNRALALVPGDTAILKQIARCELMQASGHAIAPAARTSPDGRTEKKKRKDKAHHTPVTGYTTDVNQDEATIVTEAMTFRGDPEGHFRPQWDSGDLSVTGNFMLALHSHLRTIWALILRETRTRFGRTKFGYAWALIEPALHVGVFLLLWSMRDRDSLFNMSLPMFLVTGVVPYLLFQNAYSKMVGAIAANRALLAYPQVKPFDVFFARLLLELGTGITVFVILLVGLRMWGEEVQVGNPLQVFGLMCGLWLGGAGLGLLVEPLTSMFKILQQLMNVFMRLLYFTSGIFFSIHMMTPTLREIALVNPLLHLIEMIRYNFNPSFTAPELDMGYAMSWMIGTFCLGLIAVWALRRRLLSL